MDLTGGPTIKVIGAHLVEPTDAYEDPDCRRTGPEYSSDNAGFGPIPVTSPS